MAGKVNWYGEQIKGQIQAELKRRINRCCILVYNWAKELINIDGTGVRAKSGGGRDAKGRFLKQKKAGLIYGANPSKPGEPPRKQRGRLLGSVAFEVVDLVGRVGTNLKYGRWLELGTRLMEARPWLRRALNECKDEILKILSAPMKGP